MSSTPQELKRIWSLEMYLTDLMEYSGTVPPECRRAWRKASNSRKSSWSTALKPWHWPKSPRDYSCKLCIPLLLRTPLEKLLVSSSLGHRRVRCPRVPTSRYPDADRQLQLRMLWGDQDFRSPQSLPSNKCTLWCTSLMQSVHGVKHVRWSRVAAWLSKKPRRWARALDVSTKDLATRIPSTEALSARLWQLHRPETRVACGSHESPPPHRSLKCLSLKQSLLRSLARLWRRRSAARPEHMSCA